MCQALALEANSNVEVAFEWNDYEEASLYLSPGSRSSRSRGHRGGINPRGVGFSVRTDFARGVKTLSIDEENISNPTEGKVGDIILAIAEGKHEKIDIAVSRWCKSKESFRTLADQFIDLRIALECVYLKDFLGEHSQKCDFAWRCSELGILEGVLRKDERLERRCAKPTTWHLRQYIVAIWNSERRTEGCCQRAKKDVVRGY